MRRLAGFTGAVRAAAFLPDGRLVAGGDDKWVRVFDPSGAGVMVARSPLPVYALAVSPDGKAVAYARRSANAPATLTRTVDTFSPDDRRPGAVFHWDMGQFARHVWSLSYSAGGDYLAMACREANFRLAGAGGWWWDTRNPLEDGPLPNERAAVVQFAPGTAALAVASAGNVALLTRPSRKRADRRVWPVPAAAPWSLAFTGAQSFAVSSGDSLYFVEADGSVARVRTAERFAAVAASPDGRTLLAGGSGGSVESYDARTRALRSRHDFGVGPVHAVSFAPDGLTFAVAGEGGLAVCDTE